MKSIQSLLLVDDDSFYQFATRSIIQQTALVSQVKIFSNGLDAINFLKAIRHKPKELPQVILLDIFMPVMDGWEFLEEYKALQLKPEKPIVIYMVSSSIDPRDIERVRTIPSVSGYIIKPITRERFLELLKTVH